jgi:hypothetical protein
MGVHVLTVTNTAFVTQTKEPYTVRVNFLTVNTGTQQVEAICYLHIGPDGKVEIYYDHEIIRVRAMESSPWEREDKIRLPMNRASEAKIIEGVMRAVCSCYFHFDLKTMTMPVGMDPTSLGRFIP